MPRHKNRQSLYDPTIASSIPEVSRARSSLDDGMVYHDDDDDATYCNASGHDAVDQGGRYMDDYGYDEDERQCTVLSTYSHTASGSRRSNYVCGFLRAQHRYIVAGIAIVFLMIIVITTTTTSSTAARNNNNDDNQPQQASLGEATFSILQTACNLPNSRTADCQAACRAGECCFVAQLDGGETSDSCEIAAQKYPGGRLAYCANFKPCHAVYGDDDNMDGNNDDDDDDEATTDSISELQVALQNACSNRDSQDQCEYLCQDARCCFEICDDAAAAMVDCSLYDECQGIFAGNNGGAGPLLSGEDEKNDDNKIGFEEQGDQETAPTAAPRGLDTETPTWSPTIDGSFGYKSDNNETWREWLNGLTDDDDNDDDTLKPLQTTVPAEVTQEIPLAPTTLEQTCSDEQLMTVSGIQACHLECAAYSCCYDLAVESCFAAEPNCLGYLPCLNLADEDGNIGFTTMDQDGNGDEPSTTGSISDTAAPSYSPPIHCSGFHQELWLSGSICKFPVCFTPRGIPDADDEGIPTSSPYMWDVNPGKGYVISRMENDESNAGLVKSYYYDQGDGMRFQADEASGIVIETITGAFGLKMTDSSRGLNGYFKDGAGIYVVPHGSLKASELNGRWTILSYKGDKPVNVCDFLSM